MVPTYYVLTTAEASSNLSRFDGIHYGYRSKSAQDLEEVYFNSRTEGFGEEVKRRIMLGTFVLSAGYKEAYYRKAQQTLRKIYRSYKKYTPNAKRLATQNTKNFSLGAMTKELGKILDKYVPEFAEEVQLKLPKLKKVDAPKIKLPKLKKV